MADDLVGFFFSENNPMSMRFAWNVMQRCLHGRQQVRLRYYMAHWDFDNSNKYAATLKKLVELYPLQQKCLRIPADALSEQAPGTQREIIRWTCRLNHWLKLELPDLDQSDWTGLYEL